MQLTEKQTNEINNLWANQEAIKNYLESQEVKWNIDEIAWEIAWIIAAHWELPYFQNATFLNPAFN